MKLMTGFPNRFRTPLIALTLLLLFTFLSLNGCSGGSTTGSAPQGDAVQNGTLLGGTPQASPAPVVYRHQEELAKVQEAIKRQGAQWIAGETSVSQSNENIQDSQIRDGDDELDFPDTPDTPGIPDTPDTPGIPDTPDTPGIPDTPGDPDSAERLNSRNLKDDPAPVAVIKRFSWKEKDGKNWTTAAKNQGNYGTCVAFTSIGALETQIKIAKNDAALAVDLSEWCLWREGTQRSNPANGWEEDKASEQLKTYGTVATSECPYTPSKYLDFADIASEVKRYKIKSYKWISGESEMKKALVNGPLLGSMTVFPSFDNFYASGIYQAVHTYDPKIDKYLDKDGMPVKSAIKHPILVIGYDDDQQCWICKNSNGTGWGEDGYCRIKYGITGGIANGAYQYTVDSPYVFP